MTTYDNLRDANIARQTEWDRGTVRDLDWRLNELAGEAGEVCNVIKKLERERLNLPGSRATIADLGEELGDTVVCLDLVAMHFERPFNWYPPVAFTHGWSPTAAGRDLAIVIAGVCQLGKRPFNEIDHIDITLHSAALHVAWIASMANLFLPRVVQDKFNRTSEKVGLATRLVLA